MGDLALLSFVAVWRARIGGTIGLYVGVLPGIILALAPTAFVYLATFAIVRTLLPIAPGMAANATAAVVTALLGVALAIPGALAGRAAFAATATGDVALLRTSSPSPAISSSNGPAMSCAAANPSRATRSAPRYSTPGASCP